VGRKERDEREARKHELWLESQDDSLPTWRREEALESYRDEKLSGLMDEADRHGGCLGAFLCVVVPTLIALARVVA